MSGVIALEKKLTVLIIGCGNIAGGFDENNPLTEFPVTHAAAFNRNEHFEIVACIDPLKSTGEKFRSTWGIQEYYSSTELVKNRSGEFDVISICSPTQQHESDLEFAINLKPKLIFCEKPITTSSESNQRLLKQCHDNGVLLAVNHIRRWDPEIGLLKKRIAESYYGKLRSISAIYNKGILNNGSHLLDILEYLVGDLSVQAVGAAVTDYSEQDPSFPVMLTAEGEVPVCLNIGNAKDFAVFEFTMVFSEAVVSMRDAGMRWEKRLVIDSKTFPGYKQLGELTSVKGGYEKGMISAVDNIYRAIKYGDQLNSSGDSAFKAHSICEKIHYFNS